MNKEAESQIQANSNLSAKLKDAEKQLYDLKQSQMEKDA